MGQNHGVRTILILLVGLAMYSKCEASPIMKPVSNSSSEVKLSTAAPAVVVGEGSKVKREIDQGDGEYEEDEEMTESRVAYRPMLITKKSANALNRLVNAMRTSFDQIGSAGSVDFSREKESIPNRYVGNNEMRRTQKDRKNYLRCYFNAVSCF